MMSSVVCVSLSVLMVVSLFTVCMVGSSITAGAIVNNAPATEIRVHLNGTTAQNWTNVYFVIGRDNDGYYGGQNRPKYTSFYQMSQAVDGSGNLTPKTTANTMTWLGDESTLGMALTKLPNRELTWATVEGLA